MACLNTLPIELLQNIIGNISQKPFKTELLLINKYLCSLFMTEQVRDLTLDDRRLKCWIEVVINNDIKKPYSVLQYRNLLDKIIKLQLEAAYEWNSEDFNKDIRRFLSLCKNLRNLILLNIEFPYKSLPLNIIEASFQYTDILKHEILNQSLADYLKRYTKLTKLEIQEEIHSDREIQKFSEYLKQNLIITKLSLFMRCRFDHESVCALADSLKQNTVLTDLKIFGTYSEINTEDIYILAEALKQNISLTSLNFSRCSLKAEGARALAGYLEQNTTLTKLSLDDNSIGDEGAHALAKALKQNTALTVLNLRLNYIRGDGAYALSESLEHNTTLTNLNLCYNGIGDHGACSLAKSLQRNTILINLDLSKNNIGAKGARALVESLKQNTTLTNLDLSCNDASVHYIYIEAESLIQDRIVFFL